LETECKCGKPSKYIQLPSISGCWEFSCGCGEEPFYYIEHKWGKDSALDHVGRKRWLTDSQYNGLCMMLEARDAQ